MGPYEVNTLSYISRAEPPGHTTTDLGSRHSVASMSRQQDNPHYDDAVHFGDRYQAPRQPESPVYDEALSPDRHPLFLRVPPESLPREQETNFNDSGVSLSVVPGSGSPPHEPRRAQVKTAAQPYQIPTASTGSLNKVGVANPMWGAEHPNPVHRGERRLSEGPSPNSRARLGEGCMSCVAIQDRHPGRPIGQLSTRDQTTGLSASTEDYSHLDFTPRTKSVSCLGTPQKKWYVSSEGSYASLGLSDTAIRPYASIKNSQIRVSPATSPLNKTPPTSAPPQSHAPRGPLGYRGESQKILAPPTPSAGSVPSSYLHLKEQLLTQTSLV